MAISGTITVIAPIAPSDSADVYPVTLSQYGKGGLRTVSDSTERLSISSPRREVGMLVYEQNTGNYYTLLNGITNSDWRQVLILIPDVFGNIHIDGNLIVSGFIQTGIGIEGGTDETLEYLGSGMMMDCGDY